MKDLFKENYAKEIKNDKLSKFLSECEIDVQHFGDWKNTQAVSEKSIILSQYKLVFCIEGNLTIEFNNSKYTYAKGDIFLIPPFRLYSVKTSKNIKYVYCRFQLKNTYMHEMFSKIISSEKLIKTTMKQNALIKDFFSEIHNETLIEPVGYAFKIKLLIELIILDLVRNNYSTNSDNIIIKKSNIINEFTKYVETNLSTTIKLNDLCNHLNISESKLHKLLKEKINISPKQYIIKVKMEYGILLLNDKTLQIKEIAFILGYSSQFHFSSQFKNYFGFSPSEYRSNNEIK